MPLSVIVWPTISANRWALSYRIAAVVDRSTFTETTVTVLVSGSKPRSTCSGVHGVRSSSSPKQKVYRSGRLSTAFATGPGVAPPKVCIISRSERPIVALACVPGPKQPMPQLTPTSRRMGPLIMTTGADGFVVVATPFMLNGSSRTASTIASTMGKYSGLHPAITALMATFSTVASALSGGISPMTRRRIVAGMGEHGEDALFGRRHDGQAVAPPFLHDQPVDLFERLRLEEAALQRGHGTIVLPLGAARQLVGDGIGNLVDGLAKLLVGDELERAVEDHAGQVGHALHAGQTLGLVLEVVGKEHDTRHASLIKGDDVLRRRRSARASAPVGADGGVVLLNKGEELRLGLGPPAVDPP